MPSSFAFVDSMGFFFARSLLDDAFGGGSHRADHHERAGLSEIEDKARVPRITSRVDGTPLSVEDRCRLAESMLRSMGLTRGFARLVLLVGHGSETKNNGEPMAPAPVRRRKRFLR